MECTKLDVTKLDNIEQYYIYAKYQNQITQTMFLNGLTFIDYLTGKCPSKCLILVPYRSSQQVTTIYRMYGSRDEISEETVEFLSDQRISNVFSLDSIFCEKAKQTIPRFSRSIPKKLFGCFLSEDLLQWYLNTLVKKPIDIQQELHYNLWVYIIRYLLIVTMLGVYHTPTFLKDTITHGIYPLILRDHRSMYGIEHIVQPIIWWYKYSFWYKTKIDFFDIHEVDNWLTRHSMHTVADCMEKNIAEKFRDARNPVKYFNLNVYPIIRLLSWCEEEASSLDSDKREELYSVLKEPSIV